MIELTVCTQCGMEFSYERKGSPRHLCDTCRMANIATWKAICKAVYQRTPKGRAKKAAWDKTPEGRASQARRNANPKARARQAAFYAIWCKTPEGKAYRVTYQAAYRDSPEGRAARARAMARRRERSTNPELFAMRVLQLHILKESCAACGAPYTKGNHNHTGHEVDHIRALCNGGIDLWSNYQPLCHACHEIKNAEDRKIHVGNKTQRGGKP